MESQLPQADVADATTEHDATLLVPTVFPPDEFPDPVQTPVALDEDGLA